MTKSREDKALQAFGKKVAKLRQEKGYTQEKLAEKSGLSTRTIASIEQGRRFGKLTTLNKLAKGLHVSTDELFKN